MRKFANVYAAFPHFTRNDPKAVKWIRVLPLEPTVSGCTAAGQLSKEARFRVTVSRIVSSRRLMILRQFAPIKRESGQNPLTHISVPS
jgi:hypothetical protein